MEKKSPVLPLYINARIYFSRVEDEQLNKENNRLFFKKINLIADLVGFLQKPYPLLRNNEISALNDLIPK